MIKTTNFLNYFTISARSPITKSEMFDCSTRYHIMVPYHYHIYKYLCRYRVEKWGRKWGCFIGCPKNVSSPSLEHINMHIQGTDFNNCGVLQAMVIQLLKQMCDANGFELHLEMEMEMEGVVIGY